MKIFKRRYCRKHGHKDLRVLVEKDGNPDNDYLYCAYCKMFHAAWANDIKWPPPPPKSFTKLVN